MKNYLMLISGFLLSSTFLLAQGGTLDPTFNSSGIVELKYQNIQTSFRRSQLLPDGKILTFGYLAEDLSLQAAVFKFNPDGSIDNSFGDNGAFTTQNDWPYYLGYDGYVLPDGKIMLINDIAYANEIAMMRLLPNGVIDSTFGTNGVSSAFFELQLYSPVPYTAIPQTDGKVVVIAGYEDLTTSIPRALAFRFLPDGKVDSTFGTAGIVLFPPTNSDWKLEVFGGKVQPDGKILVAGRTGSDPTNQLWYIARLMPNGSFDPSFDGDGVILPNIGNLLSDGANEILLLPDGKFIAAGYGQKLPGQQMAMMRFNANGSIDNSFGLGGKAFVDFGCCHSYIYDIIQQPDGKLVVCGLSDSDNIHTRFSVARLKANGIVDPTFGDQGRVIVPLDHDSTSAEASKVLIQPDGKILLTGNTTNDADGYSVSGLLVRLEPGTSVGTSNILPLAEYQLEIAPNPVSGNAVQVAYHLNESTEVSLSLYDVLGQRVSLLLPSSWKPEGNNTEAVQLPEYLSGGQYFIRMDTPQGSQLTKVIKTK